MNSPAWDVKLSALADRDFDSIVEWTMANFGHAQVARYARMLDTAIERLGEDPYGIGSVALPEFGPRHRKMHMRRPGRHILVYRVSDQPRPIIEILRILHDVMDIRQHLDSA